MVLEKQCKRPSNKIAINIIHTAILITGASFPLKQKKSGLVLFIFNFKTKVTREERWGKHVFFKPRISGNQGKSLNFYTCLGKRLLQMLGQERKETSPWGMGKTRPEGMKPGPNSDPGLRRLLGQRRGSRRSRFAPSQGNRYSAWLEGAHSPIPRDQNPPAPNTDPQSSATAEKHRPLIPGTRGAENPQQQCKTDKH